MIVCVVVFIIVVAVLVDLKAASPRAAGLSSVAAELLGPVLIFLQPVKASLCRVELELAFWVGLPMALSRVCTEEESICRWKRAALGWTAVLSDSLMPLEVASKVCATFELANAQRASMMPFWVSCRSEQICTPSLPILLHWVCVWRHDTIFFQTLSSALCVRWRRRLDVDSKCLGRCMALQGDCLGTGLEKSGCMKCLGSDAH